MDQDILKSYSKLNDLNVSRETFLDAGLKPAMNASHGEVENLDHQSTTDRAKLKGVEALFLLLTSTICNCHG